jgi:cysteine synthase A
VAKGLGANIIAKIEAASGDSVKCRIGASMIWEAEKRGVLKAGKEIIEPTSGNTELPSPLWQPPEAIL